MAGFGSWNPPYAKAIFQQGDLGLSSLAGEIALDAPCVKTDLWALWFDWTKMEAFVNSVL